MPPPVTPVAARAVAMGVRLLQQRSVGLLSGGDGRVRLIAQGAAHSSSMR
jgi:hypothetical protein